MVQSGTGVLPRVPVEEEQRLSNIRLEIKQRNLWVLLLVQGVGVLNPQLQKVHRDLLCPPDSPPGERIVIDHLVEMINAPHISDVLLDEFRALDGRLPVDKLAALFMFFLH